MQTLAMSTFNELSEYSTRICKDPAHPPIQWIFSVDDAWFHPTDFSPSEHMLNQPIWQERKGICIPVSDAQVVLNSREESSARSLSTRRSRRSADDAAASSGLSMAEKVHDAAVADMLVEFAKDNDYGICFCSFEFLWQNFQKTINGPQNAIFFDLNHQIAGILQNTLQTQWAEKLKGLGLFDKKTLNDTKIYGWLLYFAIRFGQLEKVKCAVDPNHLLLVSSAIAGQAGLSEDAMTQFLQVQLSMWTKLSADEAGIRDRQMTDFSFAPLPKVVTKGDPNANLLDTGLKIFNNTFCKAASWPAVRKLLLEDLLFLWSEAGEAHDANERFSRLKPDLRCYGWVYPVDGAVGDNGLRGVHYCHAESSERIAAKSVETFLKLASPQLCAGLSLPNRCSDWMLSAPTYPCLSFLIGIGDLIDNLSKVGGHATYTLPEVTLGECNDGGSPKLRIKITTSAANVLRAKSTCHDKIEDGSSATGAIQRVFRGSKVLLHHVDSRQELSAQRTKPPTDKTRKAYLEKSCCSILSDDFIKFEKGSVHFVFHKG